MGFMIFLAVFGLTQDFNWHNYRLTTATPPRANRAIQLRCYSCPCFNRQGNFA